MGVLGRNFTGLTLVFPSQGILTPGSRLKCLVGLFGTVNWGVVAEPVIFHLEFKIGLKTYQGISTIGLKTSTLLLKRTSINIH